jgi:argininosuccinate lyase
MALWGARFSRKPTDAVFALSQSVSFDWRLAPYDLRSSLAHLSVLEKASLLSKDDAAKIRTALKELLTEVASGKFAPSSHDEDVHSALERGLTEKLGSLGGSLRAGRSRNDQVTTDLRLFAIDHMLGLAQMLIELNEIILKKAAEYVDDAAPGFTHIQHAQPVSFGHEIAKHAHAFARDVDRIQDWLQRTSVSSLGAGALSGSSLQLDPEFVAKNLGFDRSFENSIDAVSDRDYVAEALFITSLIGVHLSRIGEEWTLLGSTEFSWAKIADEYSTGSSIMPQKKNPDMAELARGKAGRLIGNLVSVLTMLKGLPFAYNRDLQEDKEPLFDSLDTLALVIPAVSGMIATTNFDREKMKLSAPTGFSLATEIADYLVRKNVPFAQAHEAAGACVALCEKLSCELHDLSNDQFAGIHSSLDPKIREVLTVQGAIASRTTVGGTAPSQVSKQISNALAKTSDSRREIANKIKAFSEMMSA